LANNGAGLPVPIVTYQFALFFFLPFHPAGKRLARPFRGCGRREAPSMESKPEDYECGGGSDGRFGSAEGLRITSMMMTMDMKGCCDRETSFRAI
jgi:hypothetical protein